MKNIKEKFQKLNCEEQFSNAKMYVTPKLDVRSFIMSDVLGASDPDKTWGENPDNDVTNDFPNASNV